MKKSFIFCLYCLFVVLLPCVCVPYLIAETPKILGITVNGHRADDTDPLAVERWHTITARYKYDADFSLLTNTYLVICPGSDKLSGFYIGYHLPSNQLAIVKHGFLNATEATGLPGESGKIIENDQGYIDCENTTVKKTGDEIAVAYRVKFKKDVLKGGYNVFMYIEDKNGNYDNFDNVASISIDKDLAVYRTDMPKQWNNSLKPKDKASANIALAENGNTDYVLVIPKNAKEIESKAARDFARYFKLISGADFPIVSEDASTPKNSPFISIGRTQLLDQSKANWKNTDLAEEGYAIEVIGKNVFLYGGNGRGLMHGVYSLLEEDLGCRWYSTSSMDTPKMETFSASIASRKFVPVLEQRNPYIHKMCDSNWSLRNKTNAPHARVPLAWGGRAGSFFHHVNKIAEGVKKEFPNNHLICLAYLDYAKPPTKLKVDPYIIIQRQ